MVPGVERVYGNAGDAVVSGPRTEQWSPTSWPVSLRWRLLAAAVVLAATATAIAALSRDGGNVVEVPVVAATQRWPRGHPPGEYATVNVPVSLAALFVGPSELADTVAAVDVPEGTLVSPKMLHPLPAEDIRTAALMRFTVNNELWADPGPTAGNRAVFSASPGGCAAALVTLVAAEQGTDAGVTVEATPELAALLSDEQWWIWESPPDGWPPCQPDPSPTPQPCDPDQRICSSERRD